MFPPSCTREAYRCVEKLRALLHAGDANDTPQYSRIEKALLDLYEVDPECATMLRATHF